MTDTQEPLPSRVSLPSLIRTVAAPQQQEVALGLAPVSSARIITMIDAVLWHGRHSLPAALILTHAGLEHVACSNLADWLMPTVSGTDCHQGSEAGSLGPNPAIQDTYGADMLWISEHRLPVTITVLISRPQNSCLAYLMHFKQRIKALCVRSLI